MKQLIMSSQLPCFCDALADRGYIIIPTKNIDEFYTPERSHADMQVLQVRDKVFTLDDCQNQINRKYPKNVLLNCLYLNDKLYGNLNAVDPVVKEYCNQCGIEMIYVNQGYARCSTYVLNQNAVITADTSIEKAVAENGAEVLRISPGHIRLPGFDYGFIGGAGFCDDGNAYFFGDISLHPDYDRVEAFCKKHGIQITALCKTQPLTDIGGTVLI